MIDSENIVEMDLKLPEETYPSRLIYRGTQSSAMHHDTIHACEAGQNVKENMNLCDVSALK